MGTVILGVQGIWDDFHGSHICCDIPVGPTPVTMSLWHSHLSRCPGRFHSRHVPSMTGSSCQFPNSLELWVMPPWPFPTPSILKFC